MNAPNVDAVTAALRQALHLLNRASSEWRNGGGCESGALHWPVAVSLARRELRQALEALRVAAENPTNTDVDTDAALMALVELADSIHIALDFGALTERTEEIAKENGKEQGREQDEPGEAS